jgi:outer membrane protein TolC
MPTQEWLARNAFNKSKLHRADFEALRSQGKAQKAQAVAAKSNINPALDLTASYASNGRESKFSDSFREAGDYDYPTWTVGVSLSVPLDFGLVSDLRAGYNNQLRSAEELQKQADFQETRSFEDIFKKRNEAQIRFEKMMELEKTQARMVERERRRLSVGRTTTFQMITFEQDLAATQIQRVRAQLDLIQTHNQLKLFQEQL